VAAFHRSASATLAWDPQSRPYHDPKVSHYGGKKPI
jgi:hypothetical protein